MLLRRLGVFHGGFTAAAARGVHPDDLLDGLRRLIDKSLLIADTRAEVTRYRMLETVREYAQARLAASGEHDQVRDRHLDTYLALVESGSHLLDEDGDAWRALVDADYENIRAAIEWGLGRDDRARRLAGELAWSWHFSRRGAEGLSLLRKAIGLSGGERTALRARLLVGLALVADTTRPVPADYDAARVALDIAEEVGDARTACLARQLVGVSLLGTDLDEAFRLAESANAIAREIGYGFGRDASLALMGIVCHLRDRHARAMALLREAADGLVPRGDRGVGATALGCLAISTAHTGDLGGARAVALEAVAVAAPLGDFHRVGSARAALAYVEGLSGRFEAAWAAVEPILRLVEDNPSPPFVPWLVEFVGLLHLWTGRPDQARGWYERAEVLTPRSRIGLAIALHRTGDNEAAAGQAELVLGGVRDAGMPSLVADAMAVRAELADPDRAEDLQHEALALRVEHGLRLDCVYSLEALARLAARAGSTVEAARILGACQRAREEIGLPAVIPEVFDDDGFAEGRGMTLDEAIAYARRARGSRARPSSGWASLTPTERSVVELAVEGLSNPDIGKRLFMSRATVKTHLSHVYAKLGVANRTELAAAAGNLQRSHR